LPRAHFGPIPAGRVVSIEEPWVRRVREHGTLHIPDAREQRNDFSTLRDGYTLGSVTGARTFLFAPLRLQGEFIGNLTARRSEVRPFTSAQIKLLETFADQAVIAIENVRLFKELTQKTAELETSNSELRETLEQQNATGEILGVIASSPTDIQPVLDVVAKNAARLCDSNDAQIVRVEGDMVRKVASYGMVPAGLMAVGESRTISRDFFAGRAIFDRQTIHVQDVMAWREVEHPDWGEVEHRRADSLGVRTALATPLLRENVPIGAITIRRTEVRPFTDKQIALLKTFADQAVIAIENVRLFKDLQERNAELREALEHQTATSEVLGIISRSPTDVQPVLDAIVESAARVCRIDDVVLRLHEGNSMVPRAHFGPIPIGRLKISSDESWVRWTRDKRTLHVPDIRAQDEFPTLGSSGYFRTILAAPLRQKQELVGLLNARRVDVRPFTPAQIKLLETFADQAVIALENVRLFQELKESLEQQTATSEILGVIASSPTDIQPVLDTVAEHAAHLCESVDAQIYRVEGDNVQKVANYGTISTVIAIGETRLLSRSFLPGRAILDRQVIHIH